MNKMDVFGYMSVIVILYCSKVYGAWITTTPSNQITIEGENPTTQLRIVCTATSSFQVLILELGKMSQLGEKHGIVKIVSGNQVQVVDTSLQHRMTYAGSIYDTTGSLEITLSDLQCSDAASTYYCAETYYDKTTITVEASINITARSYPEHISINTVPDYPVYATPPVQVEFLCTGLIGNQFDQNMNMANYWVWEWRFVDDINSQWVRYTDTNSITYRIPTAVASSTCKYNGGSTLRHTLTTLDNGRQFRCYVVSPEYGNNRTVYTQEPDSTSFAPSIGVGGVVVMMPLLGALLQIRNVLINVYSGF